MTITDNQDDYVKDVEKRLKARGIRVVSDLRNEKIGFKIREHTLQATPYLLVAGHREMDNGEIAVRTQKGDDLGVMPVDDFIDHLSNDLAALR